MILTGRCLYFFKTSTGWKIVAYKTYWVYINHLTCKKGVKNLSILYAFRSDVCDWKESGSSVRIAFWRFSGKMPGRSCHFSIPWRYWNKFEANWWSFTQGKFPLFLLKCSSLMNYAFDLHYGSVVVAIWDFTVKMFLLSLS